MGHLLSDRLRGKPRIWAFCSGVGRDGKRIGKNQFTAELTSLAAPHSWQLVASWQAVGDTPKRRQSGYVGTYRLLSDSCGLVSSCPRIQWDHRYLFQSTFPSLTFSLSSLSRRSAIRRAHDPPSRTSSGRDPSRDRRRASVCESLSLHLAAYSTPRRSRIGGRGSSCIAHPQDSVAPSRSSDGIV